jgi:Tfp pilus assembly protein PilO
METGLEGKPWYFGAGVAVVMAAVLVAGGYYVKFQDMKNSIRNQEKSLDDLQKKIKEGEAAERQLPQFMEEVERLELELDKLLRILPSQRRTEDLLRRIRSLTEQGDFLLVRFSPRPITPQDDFYSEWPIQIELEGTYHNLALFFDRISRFSRIINVENLKITPHKGDKSGTGHHTIKANFTAKTFLSNDTTAEGT